MKNIPEKIGKANVLYYALSEENNCSAFGSVEIQNNQKENIKH